MISFIGTSVTISLNYNQYSAIVDLPNSQFTVANALELSVFTNRLPATALNTETSTSNSYEVFSPFLVQSLWNLGSQLKLIAERIEPLPSRYLLCTNPTENTFCF
jgi:hypothetical protein